MCISCHVCGNMYDGTAFMNVEGFKDCTDGLTNVEQCPTEDGCCFALREHISFEFWGREYDYLEFLIKYLPINVIYLNMCV